MLSNLSSPVWAMVEEQVITSPVGSITMNTPVNGNIDKEYLFTVEGFNLTGSNSSATILFNSSSMNIMRQSLIINGTSISTAQASASSVFQLGSIGTAYFYFPKMKTGDTRYCIQSEGMRTLSGFILGVPLMGNITSPANSVNITKIGLSSGILSGCGVGTVTRLWTRTL